MIYIKSYKLFESDDYIDKTIDIISTYYDCFADYVDMGIGVYLVVNGIKMVDIKNMDEIEEIINSDSFQWDMSRKLTFEMRGFITKEYENDSEKLRNICNYIHKNLKSDENRFRKISGSKLKNKGTSATIRLSDDDNDLKEFIIKSKILDFNSKTGNALFGRDNKGRNHTEYINSFSEIPKIGNLININVVHEIT
jgi:hypothetical protein